MRREVAHSRLSFIEGEIVVFQYGHTTEWTEQGRSSLRRTFRRKQHGTNSYVVLVSSNAMKRARDEGAAGHAMKTDEGSLLSPL